MPAKHPPALAWACFAGMTDRAIARTTCRSLFRFMPEGRKMPTACRAGAWLYTARDLSNGTAVGAGRFGHCERRNWRSAEASDGASRAPANVATIKAPKATRIVGGIVGRLLGCCCQRR